MIKKKILITGVAGFIGSNIANYLKKNKQLELIGIDNLSTGLKKNIPRGIKFIKADLSDPSISKKLNFKCDYIFHFAGQSSSEKSFENPLVDIKNNTLSTINLIEFSIKKKVKKIIFASSMSVYGDSKTGYFSEKNELKPKSCYGISKKTSEEYLKLFKHKVPYVVLRLFNVYGPGQDLANLKQGMVSIYISQAIKKKKIIVKGSINRFRDFVSINYLYKICEKLIFNKKIHNTTINIGTGKKTKVKELLNMIFKTTGKRKISIATNTLGDQWGAYADNNKMRKIFNIKNRIDFSKEVKDFVKWADKQKWQIE